MVADGKSVIEFPLTLLPSQMLSHPRCTGQPHRSKGADNGLAEEIPLSTVCVDGGNCAKFASRVACLTSGFVLL